LQMRSGSHYFPFSDKGLSAALDLLDPSSDPRRHKTGRPIVEARPAHTAISRRMRRTECRRRCVSRRRRA
jgi:hypothetical protein